MAVNNLYTGNVPVTALPRTKEHGVALLEAVLIIPVLLLFIGGSIDLGTLIVRYVSASRFSYEGARFAAQVSGTTPTEAALACPTESQFNFSGSDDSSDNQMMGQVCTRIKALMDGSNFDYNIERGGITFEALRPSNCSGISIASRVKVTVALNWQPTLLTFLNIHQVSASTTAPYLMNTSWDPSDTSRCTGAKPGGGNNGDTSAGDSGGDSANSETQDGDSEPESPDAGFTSGGSGNSGSGDSNFGSAPAEEPAPVLSERPVAGIVGAGTVEASLDQAVSEEAQ